MTQSTFSLAWESHRSNICNGLSSLQQNEEFVDMTLAADGHHVKVHQMVMALASPYIKQLISSAACPHPVIFLNKVSYKTLSAILEYIYTGEVLVSVEVLPELVQAAQDLHIKGLENMDVKGAVHKYHKPVYNRPSELDTESVVDEDVYFEVAVSDINSPSHRSTHYTLQDQRHIEDSQSMKISMEEHEEADAMVVEEEITHETHTQSETKHLDSIDDTEQRNDITGLPAEDSVPTSVQYTVSNQGSLQMIVNRFVYYLKHSNRNNTRQWRCVDYLNSTRCPALLVTKDDVVVQRISAHSHGFHDKRILKKLSENAVFAAIKEAERSGVTIKSKPKDNHE